MSLQKFCRKPVARISADVNICRCLPDVGGKERRLSYCGIGKAIAEGFPHGSA
jgi:hypothetical protein